MRINSKWCDWFTIHEKRLIFKSWKKKQIHSKSCHFKNVCFKLPRLQKLKLLPLTAIMTRIKCFKVTDRLTFPLKWSCRFSRDSSAPTRVSLHKSLKRMFMHLTARRDPTTQTSRSDIALAGLMKAELCGKQRRRTPHSQPRPIVSIVLWQCEVRLKLEILSQMAIYFREWNF